MPPERVLRFLLTKEASFRGFSPAPSHHLGVDVFVGTLGGPTSPQGPFRWSVVCDPVPPAKLSDPTSSWSPVDGAHRPVGHGRRGGGQGRWHSRRLPLRRAGCADVMSPESTSTDTSIAKGRSSTDHERSARGSRTAQTPSLSRFGYVLRSRVPRHCEEVALPEQAINRGLGGYHLGRRSQALFARSLGPNRARGRGRATGRESLSLPQRPPTSVTGSARAQLRAQTVANPVTTAVFPDPGMLGPVRPSAEFADSALTPRRVTRMPANSHLPGQRAAGAYAEFD